MITIVLLVGAVLAVGMAVFEWRRKDRLTAVLLTVAAVVLTALVSLVLPILALVCAAGPLYHRWGHGASVVTRWGASSRRRHGVASTFHIVRHAGFLAMRRKATTVRPSTRELTRWQRLQIRTHHFAVPLCRSGLLRVWASIEDVVLVFGAPRKGKSGLLAGRIIDAPGAVLVTSTRTDLYDITHGLRANRGPVFVFNPTGLGDLPTTVTFDPLTGCTDPVTAYERATDLVAGASHSGGSNDGDRKQWEGQARRVLTALLHAAALGGLAMHDVQQWVATPDTASREVMRLLRRSPSAAAYVPDAEQFLTTNDRTRSSITSTIAPCLGWLANPDARAAATGATPLDVVGLLRTGATVYLLGAQESQVAPLVAALTGHIAREARRIAARAPSGRLCPPLTLVLDEAALICPVPLESWTADMGGRGVHIIAAFQSRAQLISRWGATGARVILGNAGAVVLFCQGDDTEDLTHWSTLTGDRDEPVTTTDQRGRVTSRSTRKVPVITAAQLANLPKGRVVVLHSGMPPVLGWARMAWKRRDVRTHARATRRATQAVVAAAEQVTHAAQPTAGRLTRALRRITSRRPAPSAPNAPAPDNAPVSPRPWVVDTHGTTTPTTNGDRPADHTTH
ncbi:MAG: type IV secretion system protein VirD4 [Pseudonocardiales bacterium]|nr:MAG: type IV secretion system protein VirD4 [Pseudonocardiales bacterium]